MSGAGALRGARSRRLATRPPRGGRARSGRPAERPLPHPPPSRAVAAGRPGGGASVRVKKRESAKPPAGAAPSGPRPGGRRLRAAHGDLPLGRTALVLKPEAEPAGSGVVLKRPKAPIAAS